MLRPAITVSVLLSLLVGISPALAARPARVIFRDARTLSIDAKDGSGQSTIQICNVGARPALRLRGSARGFGVPIVVSKLARRLAAGACTPWTLTADSVPDGAHDGVLVVTSAGAGVARRGAAIAGKDVPPAKFAGAQDTAVIEARREGPFDDRAEAVTGEAVVYLRRPVPDLPARNAFLGSLFNGTERARVFMDGFATTYTDVVAVPVRFDRAAEVGSYSGTLDFTGQAKTDQAVKASIHVKDRWPWAVGAIVAGALLPLLLVQLPVKKWWPRFWLWLRRLRFNLKYDRAIAAFKAHDPPTFTGFERPPRDDVSAHGKQIKRAVRQYGRTTFYWDTTSEAYGAIIKSIQEIEDDIKALDDKDRLWSALDALQTELDAASFASNDLGAPAEPPLIARGKALLIGEALDVGGARAWESTASAFKGFVTTWRGYAKAVTLYTRWWWWLAELAVDGGMVPGDVSVLKRAAVELREARFELLAVSGAAELERLATAKELQALYERLAYLGAKYNRWPQTGADLPLVDMEAIYAAGLFDVELLYAINLLEADAAPLEVPGLIVKAATAPAVDHVFRIIGDLGVVLVSAAIGIVTGLNTLYFGKDFGTIEDYLTAIVVGSASAVLLKGITDNLTGLRALTADPKVELSKPAEVEPGAVAGTVALTPPAVTAVAS